MEYLRVLCAHTWIDPSGFGDKKIEVKADKARIATRQDTVNDELEKVKGTCGCAYITWVAYLATSDSDVCKIGILLLRFDLTYNHVVENLFSSVLRDIFKSNDAEGVRVFHSLVLGPFDPLPITWYSWPSSLA